MPLSLSIIVVAAMMTKLMPKIGQRIPLITGPVLITGALAWLSTVAASTSYLTGLLGPMLLYGIGTGMIFMPLTMIGVSDVAVSDTGAASARRSCPAETSIPGPLPPRAASRRQHRRSAARRP